jgi:predicted nucleic acid-binding protein
MRLVIDTNRIIAGFLRSSTTRRILFNPAHQFYAPDYVLTEIRKHRAYLIEKSHLSPADFEIFLSLLMERVSLVPFTEFALAFPRASAIMAGIDKDDAPFLAVGIALSLEGIWTEDRHFSRQLVLKVFSNQDLESEED